MSSRTQIWCWAVGLAMLDQAIKYWVLANFETGERLNVLPVFDLILLHNTGAAFSILANFAGGQRWFLLAVTAVAIVMIHRWLREASPIGSIALGLILSGALGNGVDRLVLGSVTDYLLVYYQTWFFPAFNLADIAITLGAGLLIFDSFQEFMRERANRRA